MSGNQKVIILVLGESKWERMSHEFYQAKLDKDNQVINLAHIKEKMHER
jgi:hypothetical protein